MQKKDCPVKRRVLSLFSGCGGMDLGLEGDFEVLGSSVNRILHPDWVKQEKGDKVLLRETGFSTVFANDILPFAKAAWVPFFSKRGKEPDTFHLESIVDLVRKHYNGEFKFPKGIDVVTGGFPCQDFSVSGKRKGFASDKNHLGEKACDSQPDVESRGLLYTWMREVIKIVKPRVFIAENVKGLVSLGNVREIIEKDFCSIDEGGYYIFPSQVLNAAAFGVPQNRERIFFIGFNKKYIKKNVLAMFESGDIPGDLSPYPSPTHLTRSKVDLFTRLEKLCPTVTTKQAFKGLKEPEFEKEDLAQQCFSKAKYIGSKFQGNREIKLDSVGPTIRSEHHGHIEFRRLSEEHGGKHLSELSKGLTERRLTVRECARLQTFPDDYELVRFNNDKSMSLAASSSYKLIGNAVPPLLAYSLAQKLNSIWPLIFNK